MNKALKIVLVLLICVCCVSCEKKEEENETESDAITEKEIVVEEINKIPVASYQVSRSFPVENTDDTLAMNSIVSFDGYTGQGEFYVESDSSSFDLYVNSIRVDFKKDGMYRVDYSDYGVNGKNSIQVSNIKPKGSKVVIYVPYPVVIDGNLKEEGFNEDTFKLISDIIESDIAYGFSSASLAVIRHGKLIYNNTWGYLNSYDAMGNRIENGVNADNDTMYDLASVTKVFGVNYAMQKLVSDGYVSTDDLVCEYLGKEFYENTVDSYGAGIDVEIMKKWKSEMTIGDVLRHEAGFPAALRYYYSESEDDDLFSGYEHNEETKQKTYECICKTPLLYEPGTSYLYSDVGYMLMCFVIEEVSGMSLDDYLKMNFFMPLNLSRITYNPLENGYEINDCAATEISGNTRGGLIDFPGVRTYTLQGEVHDELAYYSMNGVSGHAGLFSSAKDLAKLAYVMFTGGYGYNKYFDRNVLDYFISPNSETSGISAMGYTRQGDSDVVWYYGTAADSDTVGHQGWTGTLVMIDFTRDIVMVYLTNRINTPVVSESGGFAGGWYTAGTLGFVPEIFSIGLDEDVDIKDQLLSLLNQMTYDSMKLIPEGVNENHPSYANVKSKIEVYRKWVDAYGNEADKNDLKELEDYYNDLIS